MEQARAGAKAQREKVEGCLGDWCGPREPQKSGDGGWSFTSTEDSDSEVMHPGSYAADHILPFILKAIGYKRNMNFKGVGNPGPENPEYFFLA